MTTANNSCGAHPLVDRLFNAAFDKVRHPRSPEYKEGVRAALAYRIRGAGVRCPYTIGQVQADAFYAGLEEGHAIWRQHAEAEERRVKTIGLSTGEEPT